MNIFALDKDPELAARYHDDTLANKMILESVQILNTSLYNRGMEEHAFYKKTHQNHPCVLWASESWANFRWLLRLAHHLNNEYRYRYDHDDHHASYQKAVDNWWDGALTLPTEDDERTPFVQAMPDDVQQADSIKAYREYYQQYKATEDWFSFERGREAPEWLNETIK